MTAILDYGAGNLTSVELAFKHIGADVTVTADAAVALQADRVVFPGVGSAASGLAGMKKHKFDILLKDLMARNTPVLSICLGMQLLFESSAEDGGVEALSMIPGCVKLFDFADKSIKIPHMGWNTVDFSMPHPLWQGIPDGSAFYFVHSYYVDCRKENAAGTTEYENFRFVSAAAAGSFFATQFHPERSGKAGLAILENFLTWRPEKCC